MTPRHIVPNLLTATSLILALYALVCAERGELESAAWLIVWCVLLDIADGLVARWLDATSKFGAELDSFADLVAFGIAPAWLVMHFVQRHTGLEPTWWITAAGGAYVLCAALRLARFNTVSSRPGWFQGVPTTACGALIATGTVVAARYEHSVDFVDWSASLAVVMTGLGLMMVSNLGFPKLGLTASRTLNIPHVANIAGFYICGGARVWPEYLFGASLVFVMAGLFAGFHRRR